MTFWSAAVAIATGILLGNMMLHGLTWCLVNGIRRHQDYRIRKTLQELDQEYDREGPVKG